MSNRFTALLLMMCLFGIGAGCSSDRLFIMAPRISDRPGARASFDNREPKSAYGGWDFVAESLRADGISSKLLKEVYDKTLPPFDFVPFKLAPKETHDMYKGYRSAKTKALMVDCYGQYSRAFNEAANTYHVPKSLMLAIIVVESHCGRTTGNELIVNRLSRVVSVLDPNNVQKNARELQNAWRAGDPEVTSIAVENRAHYLFDTFYPQLRALFAQHEKGNLDVFSLRGSGAGAFGWPQFLPLTYQTYAVDGNHNGKASLFESADAIFSVGNFFQGQGWKEGLSTEEQKAIIWHYNRSTPYIETILYLARAFDAHRKETREKA